MAVLTDLYIKKETLEKVLAVLKKGGGNKGKGVSLTISINDKVNEWGQNVTAYVSQNKDERNDKKPKFYIGNGKSFWTDGTITIAEKSDSQEPRKTTLAEDMDADADDDLPF